MTPSALHGVTLAAFVLAAAPAIGQTEIGKLRDSNPKISGAVTEIYGNKFVIEDPTGRMLVETGPHWAHQLDVKPGEKVSVTGEMKEGSFHAFSITRESGIPSGFERRRARLPGLDATASEAGPPRGKARCRRASSAT